MIHPIFEETMPTAEALKKALVAFYRQKGQLQRNMENLLAIRLDDRLQEVQRRDHWGEYVDAFSLATIYSMKFKLVIVALTANACILSVQDVHGLRKDGHRISKVKEATRLLIFFQRDSHYGVGVPVNR